MKNTILLVFSLFPILLLSQTENYIKTTTYKVPTTSSIPIPTIIQASQNITYFDGLGRPIQQIAHQQSGSGKDIVTPIEYEIYGSQLKDYLPYVPDAAASLDYKSSALTDVLGYYATANAHQEATTNPYSKKEFEYSPLNRVLKQAAPGNDWALNSGHEIKLDYQTNTDADVVKLFSVTANWDVAKGLYDIPTSLTPADYLEFQLYKTITYDENTAAVPSESNGSTVEFKNKEGQVVLKRTYEASVKHDTYYIYDQYGNLTFVIPPLVDATATISNTILNDLCYQYKYDYRNRLVEKKLPGKQWEFIVYDKLDRVVATGPAFSPFSDIGTVGWLITKYDEFNRPVYTGWEQSTTITNAGRLSKQNSINGLTTINETKQSSGTIDGITANYSNTILPTTFKLLTVNYYDDYNFPNAPSFPAYSYNGESSFYNNSTMKPKGMSTGSWVRILTLSNSAAGETSYVLYDYKARPIRNYTANYMGGFTRTDIDIDFSGKTTHTHTTHKRASTDVQTLIQEYFTYSPQDRLLTHTHQINSLPVQLLASNTYDELGQLISKKVGNNTTTPLQKVDYAYNIRGWMTEINKVAALQQSSDPKDLFGFKINYNTIDGFAGATKVLYNGNIAETFWSNNADGGFVRAYGYLYDNLNRLKDATYYKTGSLPYVSKAFDENLTYDKNGNIMTLKRNGGSDVSAPPYLPLDDLLYTYAANSNKLLNVLDNSNNNSAGFVDTNKSGNDFTYDLNGNMIYNKNKILGITYNHLNLPTLIFFGTTDRIEYIYDANGKKVEKKVYTTYGGSIPVITNYMGEYQYKMFNNSDQGYNFRLQFFPTAEGYVHNKNEEIGYSTSVLEYVFNYSDHLGNVRLSYKDTDNNGTITNSEILEECNYYPFGLKHSPSAVINGQPTYKYKYQGQERQDELGLNWDSFKYRNYDYSIGRFMSIDPLAEDYVHNSTYAFAENKVISHLELEGLEGVHSSKVDGAGIRTHVVQKNVIVLTQAPRPVNAGASPQRTAKIERQNARIAQSNVAKVDNVKSELKNFYSGAKNSAGETVNFDFNVTTMEVENTNAQPSREMTQIALDNGIESSTILFDGGVQQTAPAAIISTAGAGGSQGVTDGVVVRTNSDAPDGAKSHEIGHTLKLKDDYSGSGVMASPPNRVLSSEVDEIIKKSYTKKDE